jgi:antitoxin HigA-1
MTTLRHPSIEPMHPGELVAEVLEHLGMTKTTMARRMGVTRASLHNVLTEKSAVTVAFALHFEDVTGTSAGLLVRLQATYDLWHARKLHAAKPADSAGGAAA